MVEQVLHTRHRDKVWDRFMDMVSIRIKVWDRVTEGDKNYRV